MHILHDNEHATPVDDEARKAFGAWCENMAKDLLVRLERTAGARVMMCGDVGEQTCDACVTSGQDSSAKKVGCGSALSHARDSHGVCDTLDAQTHTHTSDASDETHTHTHTHDASACKHDGCDV